MKCSLHIERQGIKRNEISLKKLTVKLNKLTVKLF